MFVRRGHKLAPIIPGGGQESNRWSGTQNVAGAVGLATALEIAVRDQATNACSMARMRDSLIAELTQIPGVYLTGHPVHRLPHIASFRLEGLDGQSVVVFLDSRGVCASTGSACSSGTVQASPVLRACGLSETEARGSLRLSVGTATTLEELRGIGGLIAEVYAMETVLC